MDGHGRLIDWLIDVAWTVFMAVLVAHVIWR